MVRRPGRERSRRTDAAGRENPRRHPARPDDAGDGRVRIHRRAARQARVAAHPGPRRDRARPERGGPAASERRGAADHPEGRVRPRPAAARNRAGARRHRGAWGRSRTDPRDPARGRPMSQDQTLLVVDDNEDNLYTLTLRLTREGYKHIVKAGNGREALELLRAQPFDLVLLDIMMPEMNGYEALAAIKGDARLRHIPVIMISAVDEIDSVIRCIEQGAEDYLSKPFNPVLLRARVSACLEKKRLRDQEAQHAEELAEVNRTLEQRVHDQVAQLDNLGRLKRFFSPQLAELIVAGGADDPLKTHRREVTVVFLDLRGFTPFAETAEPEEVMGVLREYHAKMGKLILEHEGTLERFAGDGMMVFFNDPVPVPNPAERAARMALAMRDRVRHLSAGWQKRGYDLALGVGIAQGYATIGAIGFEGRWDYGAIGTVTNLAARLCAEAKGDQILVSSRVASVLEELIEFGEVGELTLKGFLKPVFTFNAVGPKARPS